MGICNIPISSRPPLGLVAAVEVPGLPLSFRGSGRYRRACPRMEVTFPRDFSFAPPHPAALSLLRPKPVNVCVSGSLAAGELLPACEG